MKINEFKKKIKKKDEKLFVTINDKETSSKIKYSITNEATLWRAQTLFTKEPVTINWIRNFSKKSIFFDVGANVGMYSIFASIVSDAKVYSFEPESGNFHTLMENIVLNELFERINPYPIALSNKTELSSLYLNSFMKGDSHHMLGKSLNHNLKPQISKYTQGIFSTTLDDLIDKWGFPTPDYLKIDVDGIEHNIIKGSSKLLKNKKLNSILIEINPKRIEDKEIIKFILSNEFKFDDAQVEKSTRNNGEHKGYAEYLFYRK